MQEQEFNVWVCLSRTRTKNARQKGLQSVKNITKTMTLIDNRRIQKENQKKTGQKYRRVPNHDRGIGDNFARLSSPWGVDHRGLELTVVEELECLLPLSITLLFFNFGKDPPFMKEENPEQDNRRIQKVFFGFWGTARVCPL